MRAMSRGRAGTVPARIKLPLTAVRQTTALRGGAADLSSAFCTSDTGPGSGLVGCRLSQGSRHTGVVRRAKNVGSFWQRCRL